MEDFKWKLYFGETVTDITMGRPISKSSCEMLITDSQKELLDTISNIEIDENGNKYYVINRQKFKLGINFNLAVKA